MAYVAPSTVSSGDAVTAANHNIIVNDVLALRAASTYIATQTRGTSYTISSTTVAGAADMFASDITFTAEAGKLYKFELYANYFQAATADGNYDIFLVNGAGTSVGGMGFLRSGAANIFVPLNIKLLYAAGSGSVSFNIRATKSSGASDGSIDYGAFGARFTVYGPID